MSLRPLGTKDTNSGNGDEVKGLKTYIERKMQDLKTIVQKEIAKLLKIDNGLDVNGHNLDPSTVLMNKLHEAVTDMLFTQYPTINDHDNLDPTHPWVCRVFIPPNVAQIKKGVINVIASRYRMDAATTDTKAATTSSVTITSGPSNKTSAKVRMWGPNDNIPHPKYSLTGYEDILALDDASDGFDPTGYKYELGWNPDLQATVQTATISKAWVTLEGVDIYKAWTDLYRLQHSHDIDHYHVGSSNVTIPGHGHSNVPGIFESSNAPQHITCKVNDQAIGIDLTGDNATATNVDITSKLIIGQWNTLEFSGSNEAHVTVFGHMEVLQQYSVS